jgi:5'-3' exoribonuclease 2
MPKNENDMFLAIFDYIDRLFNMIRPRKLLYFALGTKMAIIY